MIILFSDYVIFFYKNNGDTEGVKGQVFWSIKYEVWSISRHAYTSYFILHTLKVIELGVFFGKTETENEGV
jgi:hypothetical protein